MPTLADNRMIRGSSERSRTPVVRARSRRTELAERSYRRLSEAHPPQAGAPELAVCHGCVRRIRYGPEPETPRAPSRPQPRPVLTSGQVRQKKIPSVRVKEGHNPREEPILNRGGGQKVKLGQIRCKRSPARNPSAIQDNFHAPEGVLGLASSVTGQESIHSKLRPSNGLQTRKYHKPDLDARGETGSRGSSREVGQAEASFLNPQDQLVLGMLRECPGKTQQVRDSVGKSNRQDSREG